MVVDRLLTLLIVSSFMVAINLSKPTTIWELNTNFTLYKVQTFGSFKLGGVATKCSWRVYRKIATLMLYVLLIGKWCSAERDIKYKPFSELHFKRQYSSDNVHEVTWLRDPSSFWNASISDSILSLKVTLRASASRLASSKNPSGSAPFWGSGSSLGGSGDGGEGSLGLAFLNSSDLGFLMAGFSVGGGAGYMG